jgi:hypothetical protein
VKYILRRRPSPAFVIACVALFVSLGGVSYAVATGSIDSRELKNNSVRSKDVRNNTLRTFDIRNNEVRGFDIRNSTVQGRDVAFNTLTGADISESSLTKVPSAATADSAGIAFSAGNANTVGGMSVRKIFAKQAVGTGVTEIFRGDGFALEASCSGAAAGLQLDGVAGAAETNATWQVANQSDEHDFAADADLNAGDDHTLVNTDVAPGGVVAGQRSIAHVTVSTTGGGVTTVQIAAQDSPAFQGEAVCAFRGTAVSG